MHRHHFPMQWMGNAKRYRVQRTSQCMTSKIQYHFPNWLVRISMCLLLLRAMLLLQLLLLLLLRLVALSIRYFRHTETETNKSQLKILLYFVRFCSPHSANSGTVGACVRVRLSITEINWKLCFVFTVSVRPLAAPFVFDNLLTSLAVVTDIGDANLLSSPMNAGLL